MYGHYLSKLNYLKHLLSFDKNRGIRKTIISYNKKIENEFDYNLGFFYQSFPKINLSGLRNTSKRVDILNLNKYFLNKEVLDIGSNIGAILMNTKCTFKYAVGVEYNKYLIKISNELKDYLDLKNCEFYCDDFMKIELDKKFDVILSLANHHTFDKNIDNTDLYFKKIYNLLKIDGILIFESHSPLYEKEKDLILVLEKLKTEYEIIENGIYKFGNFFDLNRKFFIFKKK